MSLKPLSSPKKEILDRSELAEISSFTCVLVSALRLPEKLNEFSPSPVEKAMSIAYVLGIRTKQANARQANQDDVLVIKPSK